MRLVKSLLAGIFAVAVTAFLLSIFTFCYVQLRLWMNRHSNPGDTFWVVVHWKPFSLESLALSIVVFIGGAYWMLRRSQQ